MQLLQAMSDHPFTSPKRGRWHAFDRTIYDYSSTCYYEVVYIQGGNVIDRVRRRIGSTAFWRAMRSYVADHRNRIASTLTLLNALEGASSHDLTDIFAPRFPRLY